MKQKSLQERILECIGQIIDYSGTNEYGEKYCLLTDADQICCPFMSERIIKVPNIPYDQIRKDGEYAYETKHHLCEKNGKEKK